MKQPIYILSILLILLFSCSIKAGIKLPNGIDLSTIEVLSIDRGLMTVRSIKNFEIWQINTKSQKIENHFKLTNTFKEDFFKSYFKDNSKILYETKSYFEKYDANIELVNFQNCFIDPLGGIYAIVKGSRILLAPNGNPDSATLVPFYAIIKIENNTVSKIYPIYLNVIGSEYLLRGDGDFFVEKGDFYLTVSKSNVNESENYFLTKWQFNKDELVFKEFLKIDLPRYHIKTALNYGLLRFIYKKPHLMFYSCPTIYDVFEKRAVELEDWSSTRLNFNGISKGGAFPINSMVCDYYFTSNELKVIIRRGNKFFIEIYSPKTFVSISKSDIKDIIAEELYRFPFFTGEGAIIIVSKKLNEIQIINT